MRSLHSLLHVAVLLGITATPLTAQNRMPREDVIDVPAISDGLCVHNLFQSHMVVQRDKPIRIRGWAKAGERVWVSFGSETEEDSMAVTANDDRTWSVELPARAASSEPHKLTIKGRDETLALTDILIGDVWVLGGQSNMEFPLERVDNGWLEIVSANYEGIRVLTVPAQNGPEVKNAFPRLHEWSGWSKRHFRKGDWDRISPKIAQELSAIGYVFARRLHMASQVPIGIVDVSRGGTTVETWTPDAVLRELGTPDVAQLLSDWDKRVDEFDPAKDLEQRQANHDRRVADREKKGEEIPGNWVRPTDLRPGPKADQNRPSNCWNSMIAPIAGLSVKGVIFHQGYNNANGGTPGARRYKQIFGAMIPAWREAFRDPELPFGIISLCTDGDPQDLNDFCERMFDNGVLLREAQYQTFVEMREAGDTNVGFASSYDKRRSWYHPQEKLSVGERIARWALATQYGFERRIRWMPPVIESMEVVDGTIVLRMDRAVAPADMKAAIEGFAIAGEDRRFHPATAVWGANGVDGRGRPRQDRRVVVLSSAVVPDPLHFRYAWARNPMGNLQSADHNDLPLATQRSDSWPIEDVPLGVLAEQELENGTVTRRQRGMILRALREQDMARRIAEAKALLEEQAGK